MNSPAKEEAERIGARSWWSKGRYLLLAAAIFHLFVSVMIVTAGRFGLLSSVFDSKGVGISFASDSIRYFADVTRLVEVLKAEGLAAWFNSPFPQHTKLYSLTFAALGPLVGFNILAVEPVNLVCYLVILGVVFKLGSEVFDRRVGLVSATVVAAWPTFLLHTTQVLKDPLFIAAFLGLILLTSRWLTRSFTFKQGLTAGASGGALMLALWLTKPDAWELVLIVVAVSMSFLLLRAIKERRILKGNAVAACLLLVFLLGVPSFIKRYRNPNPHPILTRTGAESQQQISIAGAPGAKPAAKPPSRSSGRLTRLREGITWARYLYDNYPVKGSNIDGQVRLESWGEIIRYLPRATEIGLFAPFPDTWLGSGSQVGRGGRMVAGFETLLMYCAYLLSAVALWQRRKDQAVWFLATIAISGVIALSVVVANVGALYRLRYPFWMLLIVVAVDGAFAMRRIFAARQSAKVQSNSNGP